MKYGILLAMGMIAATALVGADRAVNAFLAVDGDGVSIDDDGSIVCDRSAAGSVTVSARPGWLVNGRESVSVDPKRGSGLKVTSKLGEDEEYVHVFPQTVEDDHLEDIVLVAEATPASQIAMYVLPDTSTVVSASATHKVDKCGKHRVTTTYYPCVCGEVHAPPGVRQHVRGGAGPLRMDCVRGGADRRVLHLDGPDVEGVEAEHKFPRHRKA